MKKSLTAGLLIFAFLVASVPMANAQTTGAADDQALIQQLEAVIASLTQQIAMLIQQRLAAQPAASHLEVDTEDTGTLPANPSTDASAGTSSSNGPTAIVRGVTITESILNGVPCGPNSLNQTITFKPGQPFCLRFSAQNYDEGLPHGALDDQSRYYDRVSIDTPTNSQFTFSLGNNQWDSHWNQNDNVYVQATPSAALQNGTYPLRFHVAARKCVISKVLGSTISTDCGGWTEAYVSSNVVVDNGQGTVTTTGPSVVIDASQSVINAGQSVSLSWSSTNAVSCTGNAPYLTGLNGSTSFSPTQTTTYTLTCTDAQGRSGTATTLVTVNQFSASPSLTFSASPSSIQSGQSTQLSLNAANAGFCQFSDGNGVQGWNSNSPYSNGSYYYATVHPTTTTTYTATCWSNGTQSGTSSAKSVTVNVGTTPAPSVTSSVTLAVNGSHGPVSVTSGSSATVAWTLGGSISSCTINDSLGKYSYIQNQSSSVSVPITASDTFSISCNGGAASDSVLVNVSSTNTTTTVSSGSPVLTSFAASPSSITSGQPVMVSLYADLSNAANKGIACTVSPLVGSGLMNNNVQVYPTSNTTFTATCTNSAGLTTTKTSSVTVSQQTTTSTTSSVPSVSVSASPSSISAGGSTTITWSSTNASYCSWTAGSKMNPNGTAATLATSGSQTVTPVAGTDYSASVGVASYYVSCYNGSGGATGSANVTVNSAGQTSAAYNAIEALIQSISASIANLNR